MGILFDLIRALRLFVSGPENISKEIDNGHASYLSASLFYLTILALVLVISSLFSIPPTRVTADRALYGFIAEEAIRTGEDAPYISFERMVGVIQSAVDKNPKKVDLDYRLSSPFSTMSLYMLKAKLIEDPNGFGFEQLLASKWPGGSNLGFFLEWHTGIRYADELVEVIDENDASLIRDYYKTNEYWNTNNVIESVLIDIANIIGILVFALILTFVSKKAISIKISFIFSCYLFSFVSLANALFFLSLSATGLVLLVVYPLSLLAGIALFQYWLIFVLPKLLGSHKWKSFLIGNGTMLINLVVTSPIIMLLLKLFNA